MVVGRWWYYKLNIKVNTDLSAIGPPMTQPSRSPITNKLAETFPGKYPSVWLASFDLCPPTYPGAFLQRGCYLWSWLLELGDQDGREAHGEASTQPREVGHQPGQELKGGEGGDYRLLRFSCLYSPSWLEILLPPPSPVFVARTPSDPPQQAELPSLMIVRKPESFQAWQ